MNAEWYDDRRNLAAVARYMYEQGDTADEVAYMLEKPWKFEEDWRLSGPEGVGTGAGEGAPRQDTGSAWVTRSEDCPEAPAQAHPLAIDPAAVVSDEAYAAGYRDGRAEVSVPAGLTISDDGALLNWLGVNYVRQGETLSAEVGERYAPCFARGVDGEGNPNCRFASDHDGPHSNMPTADYAATLAALDADTRADWRHDARPTNYDGGRTAILARRIIRLLDALDEAEERVARLLCERHQAASPTRQPCAACVQIATETEEKA